MDDDPPAAPAADSLDARLSEEGDARRREVVELERALGDLVAAAQSSNNDDEHDPEGATVAFERAQLQALLAAARTRVDSLDRAARRLRAGSYGRCLQCGAPIAPARLAALPDSERCLACAGGRPGPG